MVNVLPVVSIEEVDSGKRLTNATVEEKGPNQWTATYSMLRQHYNVHYKITVSVDGIKAKGSPFTILIHGIRHNYKKPN